MAPITTAAHGSMMAQHPVIPTSPVKAPFNPSEILSCNSWICEYVFRASTNSAVTQPAAPPKVVLTTAMEAICPASAVEMNCVLPPVCHVYVCV